MLTTRPPLLSNHCERCNTVFRRRNNKCPTCYTTAMTLRSDSKTQVQNTHVEVPEARVTRRTNELFETVLRDAMQDIIHKGAVVADHCGKKTVRDADMKFVLNKGT